MESDSLHRQRAIDWKISLIALLTILIGAVIFYPVLAGLIVSMIFINKLTLLLIQKYILGLFLASGKSMQPFLPDGVKLTIDMYPSTIKPNDIITYYTVEDTTLFITQHRVESVSKHTVSVQGEHSNARIEHIPKENIISKTLSYKDQPFYIPVSPISIRETIQNHR